MKRLARYRKAIAGAVSLVVEVIAAGVLHGTALYVAQGAVAVAGVAGIVATPNAVNPNRS